MKLTRRHWLADALALGTLPALAPGLTQAQAALPATGGATRATPGAQALHTLFARHWDETARQSPESATYRGDHRFNDRWADVSPAADAARQARNAAWLAEARAIAPEALSATDRTSRAMFIHNLEAQQRIAAFEGWRTLSLGALFGLQQLLASVLQQMPIDTPEQRAQLLARLAAWPQRMAQEIARLERGIALGWVSPRPVLERVLAQLDRQIGTPLRQGPFFEPFSRRTPVLSEGQAQVFQAAGEVAITAHVLPAMRRLRDFVAGPYLAAAPAAGGLARQAGGAPVYADLVRQATTTALTPQQIHDTGLAEMARLHAQFRQLMAQMDLKGSFAEAVAALNAPDQFFASPEAMLEGYRAVAKRLDPEMPRLFAELPRTPYGIRAMPDHLGPGAADNYTGPPADGSGPGWYNANVLAFARRPRWALPTLVAHETVPGHHLQVARARELDGLPAFRRQGGYTAFVEGWGLYAERLMDETGFYTTPQQRWGFLQAQAFRAARLVVDTGLHAFGWSREQAIAYMVDHVGESPVFMTAEVDRYLSQPGQALAYMVGQLHILALRDQARQALGAGFDLRRFNNAVIDQGALPLDVLSTQIADWTAAERTRPAA
ncbi:DUF885 domain-containing protein [Ideonella sp. DXS22W]|uniref:DUF885 domain-containing protein n=1 Tax=Pseudaquabacterium inlustre TaxID=2984192 RepID=A0ABU9CMW3_9BURK